MKDEVTAEDLIKRLGLENSPKLILYSVIKRALCKYGMHNWIFKRGQINKYYECKRCKKRKVKENLYIYQPIDIEWLNGL